MFSLQASPPIAIVLRFPIGLLYGSEAKTIGGNKGIVSMLLLIMKSKSGSPTILLFGYK
ncbi:hypothetical protein D3C87_1740040 [compost metagenome]